VSCHVVFLKHIHFFSIPSTSHSLTRPDLIRIDPFSEDSNSLSSLVPSTSKTPPHIRPFHIDHSVGTDTLLSSTPEAPSKFVDPPLR
jgi:hypothetical protein